MLKVIVETSRYHCLAYEEIGHHALVHELAALEEAFNGRRAQHSVGQKVEPEEKDEVGRKADDGTEVEEAGQDCCEEDE